MSSHPVYKQLNDQLRLALKEGYESGDKFLTEREISRRFEVSRATANKVLASLVSEGLLEFRRGLGTFVREGAIDYDVRSLVSFTQKARAAGKKPSTEVLRLGVAENVGANVLSSLGVSEASDLLEMERLRFADGDPVILEHRFLVSDLCGKIKKKDAQGSLYEFFTKINRFSIAGADEIIRAVSLKTSEAKLLQTSVRSPAIEVTAVGFVDDAVRTPLWWERTLYRGDMYELHCRLGPIKSATPARGTLR